SSRPISLGVGNWTPNWGATQNRGDVELTLDTVEVRATRSNISSIQIRASDQELHDQALMRAVGAQTVENIRADRRRSNAIDVGAFQRSNALDIGAINAARMAPATTQPVAPMPVNREAIPLEPNSISGWEVAGSFVEGVGNAFVGVGREVADTPLRVGDMVLAAAAMTTNLFREEGDYWLPEMNSGMSRDYERSGQTWDQFALDHNPLYAATVGLGTAIGNGAGAAVVDNDYRPLANLGGEFAGGLLVGKAMNRYGNYGVMIDDIGASGLGRSQAGSVGVRFGRSYPDGSFRTPDGKFVSVRGAPAPGTINAVSFANFLQTNGVKVVGTEMEVVTPVGIRKYDVVTRNADGSLFGLEIKSGGATPTPYQRFVDMYVNNFGAQGRGRIAGEKLVGSYTVYLPSGG
ncbi:hypothetical protein, partial [Xanthomonas arboricola]|uniref:hypothetical protein n=3 Tax=Xanthomonas arboricola TaxID=56448 RepID=UPI004040834B